MHGALLIPTPRVDAAGPLEGWHCIVMARLAGRPPSADFDETSPAARPRIFSRVGEAIAGLHALDVRDLPRDDWAALVIERRAACTARHRRQGLDEAWLARIDPFLDELVPELPIVGQDALLHPEIMREHVFVAERAVGFEVSGLLDFEPSEVGPREYELAAVGLFLSAGDPELWTAFLDGLGIARAHRGQALARRCMAWALLHRYANLGWWLGRLPARSPRRSFDDLAREWFRGPD